MPASPSTTALPILTPTNVLSTSYAATGESTSSQVTEETKLIYDLCESLQNALDEARGMENDIRTLQALAITGNDTLAIIKALAWLEGRTGEIRRLEAKVLSSIRIMQPQVNEFRTAIRDAREALQATRNSVQSQDTACE